MVPFKSRQVKCFNVVFLSAIEKGPLLYALGLYLV